MAKKQQSRTSRRIEDVKQPRVLSGVTRDPRKTGEQGVTLSGRCGDCGYLLKSAGHKFTCG